MKGGGGGGQKDMGEGGRDRENESERERLTRPIHSRGLSCSMIGGWLRLRSMAE